jgi:uncharacterized protein (DUF433 family)
VFGLKLVLCYAFCMSNTNYQLPQTLVTTSADWLGGEPCFTGRRVAVKALFDYLKAGHTLEDFLGDFPSVSREHAIAVIDLANFAVALTDAAE